MADLLAQWGAANITGPDWLPRIVQAGLSLRNDRQRLALAEQEMQMRQQALIAEQARYARQEDFQERKFMYGAKQDQLQQARQSTLDNRAWLVQQAQIQNMNADNARAASAADRAWEVQQAQMQNMRDDNSRQRERFEWERSQNSDSSGLMDWIKGDKSWSPSSLSAPAPAQQKSYEFTSPYTGPLGGSIGEPQPSIYGADPALTSASAPAVTGVPEASSAGAEEHPGREKYEFLQRASAIDPRLVWNMKPKDREAALQIIGRANALKADPDVLDYTAQLQRTNDARTAQRQKAMIQHYYGSEMPFNGSVTAEMQRLDRGLPLDNWAAAAESEISAQKDMRGQIDEIGRAGLAFSSDAMDNAAGGVRDEDRRRTPTADSVIKAKAAVADAKRKGEDGQWTDIKTSWAKENPDLFRVIVEVASKEGATEKDLKKALYDKVGTNMDALDKRPSARTRFYHPDPGSRRPYKTEVPGLGWLLNSSVDKVNGEPLSNFDIASILFDEVRQRLNTYPSPASSGTTRSGNGFTIGQKVEEK